MFSKKFRTVYSALSKKNRFLLFLTISLLLVSSIIDLIGVVTILPFLSLILDPSLVETNKYYSFVFNYFNLEFNRFIIYFGIIFLIIIFLNTILRFTSKLAIQIFSRHIIFEMSTGLYEYYLHRPYKFFLKNNKAVLTQKCTDYVESLVSGVFSPAITIFYLSVNIVPIFLILIYFQPLITGYLILFLILYYIIFFRKITKKVQKAGGQYENFQDHFAKIMIDSFNIIKQLQLSFKQKFFINNYSALAKNYRNAYLTSFFFGTIPLYVIEFFLYTFITIAALLLFFYFDDYKTIVPLIIFFVTALRRIVPSVQDIYYQLLQITFHKKMNIKILPDINLMTKFYKDLNEKQLSGSINFKKNIRFDDVEFSYDKSRAKFKFNVDIRKGQFIGVAGKSGNGKSTFINILCGFLDPDKGSIKIDDLILNKLNKPLWQKKVGYVPQEVSLIHESIAKNITLDEKKNTNVLKFLRRILNLKFSISNNSHNEFGAKIGDKGLNLSGGQQQRISIARSLSKNPEVIVFDEATNSLDLESEYEILNNIRKHYKNKTFIICTHRLQTLKKCNTILYFKDNKIKRNCNFNKMIKVEKDFLNSLRPKQKINNKTI